MTAITVENLSVKYTINDDKHSTIKALDNVSLDIKDGESLAILGPSGCGKTTLLRMIAGLSTPDSGRVLHDNVPIQQIEARNRVMGMVFQEYALIPHWEAERNVGFFLRLRKRQAEVPQRVHQVSRITGFNIDYLMERLPRTLSGGEKQRVAIARAFARDLRLLLFDEPFANLDAKFRGTARVELKRLLNQFPVTSIFVTHDQIEAAILSQRIILMRDGRIEQIGDYDHLLYNPSNIFVAEFIGTPTINLFQGITRDNRWQGAYFGNLPVYDGIADGRAITMGIRPDALHLVEDGVAATITNMDHFFAERYTVLEVASGEDVWRIQIPLEDGQNHRIGDTIHCAIDARSAIFFDTHTQQRIA